MRENIIEFDAEEMARLALEKAKAAKPNGHAVEASAVLEWTDTSSWDSEPCPEREWAVTDRIPLRQVTLFSGEGTIGKSIAELMLSVAHVTGKDWFGSLPEAGGAFYCGCEDEEKELRIRLSAIARHYGTTFDELKANGFRFKSFAGEDAILGALNRNGRIEPTALYNQLYEQAGDLKPKHIGIDTSADVFAGNEIDRAQVRQFISLLRRLAIVANGSVVLLSHPSLTGISSGSGLSGSTAWHNSVRSRIYMTSPKPEAGEQPDSDLREIKFKKANYSAVANSLVVRYRSGVFVPEGAMTTIEMAAREAEVEDTFISIVRKLEAVGQELSAAESRSSAVAAVAKHPDVPKGMRRPEFVTAQAKLLERGRLRIETLRSGTTREKKVIKTA